MRWPRTWPAPASKVLLAPSRAAKEFLNCLPNTPVPAARISGSYSSLLCIAPFTLSSLLCGIAPSLAMLVLLSVIQGAGKAGIGIIIAARQSVLRPTQVGTARGLVEAGRKSGACASGRWGSPQPQVGGHILTRSASDSAFIFCMTRPPCALPVISLIPSSAATCLLSIPLHGRLLVCHLTARYIDDFWRETMTVIARPVVLRGTSVSVSLSKLTMPS